MYIRESTNATKFVVCAGCGPAPKKKRAEKWKISYVVWWEPKLCTRESTLAHMHMYTRGREWQHHTSVLCVCGAWHSRHPFAPESRLHTHSPDFQEAELPTTYTRFFLEIVEKRIWMFLEKILGAAAELLLRPLPCRLRWPYTCKGWM